LPLDLLAPLGCGIMTGAGGELFLSNSNTFETYAKSKQQC
jgi:hypothetical protein